MRVLMLTLCFFFNTQTFADPCDMNKVAAIKKLISPDISLNRNVVTALMDGALKGELKCDLITTKRDRTVSLGSCGTSHAVADVILKVANVKQVWIFKIREDEVECGGNGFWLTDLTTDRANIVRSIYSGDRIIGQRSEAGCEKASDFRPVIFSNQNLSGEVVKNIRIVNTNQRSCDSVGSTFIEFSANSLGLVNEDLSNLK